MFHVLLLIMAVSHAMGQEPFADSDPNLREGSCSSVPIHPVKASRKFIDSLHFSHAGNRFTLYDTVAAMPNPPSLREDDFYYDACYNRNITSTTGGTTIGTVYGFGQVIVHFRVTPKLGMYFEGHNIDGESDPNYEWDRLTEIVTLTDHKSFAFSVFLTKLDRRGWVLHTLTPELDSRTRTIVEDHAVSLGFKRENFVFLRYDSCRLGSGNPNLKL